jgi:gamma-polyglutamate biosynthesis protein CapA
MKLVLAGIGGGALMLTAILVTFFASSAHAPITPEMSVSFVEEDRTETTRVLFVGDMFFDRFIRRVMETAGDEYVFSCIATLLARADFVVGNLEGPITPHDSVTRENATNEPDHFKFTFSPSIAETLARYHFAAVNLGNNHIGNFGLEGMHSTREYLGAAGIGHFGGLGGDEPILHKDSDGVRLSFVSYNQFGGDSAETVSKKIAAEHALGRVVMVYAHWGEEYSTSSIDIRKKAELFANAGASAIIGSHPHVVGTHEYIGNTLVYYSLGNFIFDQYWNDEVTNGLAVLLHISDDANKKISATEHPTISTKDGRVCVREIF